MRTGPLPDGVPHPGSVERSVFGRALVIEIVVVVATMASAAAIVGSHPWELLVLGSAVLVVLYQSGRDAVRPGLPTAGRVVRDLALVYGAVAVATTAGWVHQDVLETALAVMVAGGSVALVAAAVRVTRMSGVRVVVVGPPAGIAEAFARWAQDRRVRLVGSLLVDEEQPGSRPGERFRAQDPRELILGFRPDMVMVVPGPGVDAEVVRRMGWALEGTGAGLAVCSRMEGIAAHRIQHARMAGMSVMQVKSSRPPWLVRAVKVAADRVLAVLLLVLLSPLLAALIVLVRVTSRGPGLFTQVRVGRRGEPFTMYKLRTMRADAEKVKPLLRDLDEGNGLLFKKRHDPRITPVGRLLRKYSLDELPQLVNVLKGDMSLIGPRPALLEEVARYTSLERRRLAVRPGMTGKWQVSGRSTLGREESMVLDLDYTDNYRLVDDAVIALRTVDAVVRPQGAW